MNKFDNLLVIICNLPIALVEGFQKMISTLSGKIITVYLYYALSLLSALVISILLIDNICLFVRFDNILQSIFYILIFLLALISIQFVTCKTLIYLQYKNHINIFSKRSLSILKYIHICITSIIFVFFLSIKNSLFTYLWNHYPIMHISDISTTNLLWDLFIGTLQVTNIIFSIFIEFLNKKMPFNPNFRD